MTPSLTPLAVRPDVVLVIPGWVAFAFDVAMAVFFTVVGLAVLWSCVSWQPRGDRR